MSFRLRPMDARQAGSAELNRSKWLVGSDPRCDFVLDVPGVSPHHCYLLVHGEGVRVVDLDSKNGVYVNGLRAKDAVLFAGDALTLGDLAFRLENALEARAVLDCEAHVPVLAAAVAAAVVEVPAREGLVLVDQEYCDLQLAGAANVVEAHLGLPESAADEALDDATPAWEIVRADVGQRVEVITYSSGNVLDVAYVDPDKDGVVLSPEMAVGKVWFPALKAEVRLSRPGQKRVDCPEGFTTTGNELNADWLTLTLGNHQVSLRLVEKTFRVGATPFWGRDGQFYREAGKTAAAVFLPFLLLLLITLPEIKDESAKQVTIIYKAAEKTDGESKTEVAATEVTSKTENTGTKTTEQPKQKPQMAQASSAAKAAESTPAASAPAAPKAYSFKSSVSLDSVVADAPTAASGQGRTTASTKTSGFGASAGALSGTQQGVGTGVGVGSLGSDASGSASTSAGAKGLVSKKGFDHSYLEPKTVILGSMDPELLRKILQEYLPQFRHCYQQELMGAGKDLKGVIDLDFQISPTGRVSRTDVKAKDARFTRKGTDCMVAVLRIIEFPKPKGGGVVDVRQPLNFFAETEKI